MATGVGEDGQEVAQFAGRATGHELQGDVAFGLLASIGDIEDVERLVAEEPEPRLA